MIPGQISVSPPEPEPYRYTCHECGGPVPVLPDVGVMPRPCGHNAASVRAACAAVITIPLTATGG